MTQTPWPWKVTVEPDTEHTPLLKYASVVKMTGRPDVAVAVTVYGGLFAPTGSGGVEVNVIVCDPRAIVNDCCTCGAAAYVPFPAWFASIVHVPARTMVRVEPEMVQTAPL